VEVLENCVVAYFGVVVIDRFQKEEGMGKKQKE